MTTLPKLPGRGADLVGRKRERHVFEQLLAAVRAGKSRVLVVLGEPGVGKSALLEYLIAQASGCRVGRAAGVQSEMELAFSGLHQLVAPMLDRLDDLPVPQRDALRSAFGIGSGSAPDRFLVGLAVLGLLSDAAEKQPLICVVDDQQWLDHVSAQVLAFVARRLEAEAVGMVFAARAASDDLVGLPELIVEGLRETDALVLLDSAVTGPLDAGVRYRIVAETRGNPLALLELPRRADPGGTGGRVRRSRSPDAVGTDRGELPSAPEDIAGRDPFACCRSRRPSRWATRRCCGGRPNDWPSRPRRRRPR